MSILVFGSINVDHVLRVDRISRPGETNMANEQLVYFGGKGANQAIAAARASLSCKVVMAGAIGSDDLGKDVLANFVQNGVDVKYVSRSDVGTGTAYVFVDPEGENAITVLSGANADVGASELDDGMLGEVTHLLLQMEVPLVENIALSSRYKTLNPNGIVIVNLAPVPSSKTGSQLAKLLRQADILVVNEHELTRTSEILDISGQTDIQDMAMQLARVSGSVVVVTLGSKGVISTSGDGETLRVQPTTITPIDTTGAGDTFTGVLASSLAENLGLRASLERASHAGALACLKMGAQAAMPFARQLEKQVDAG